MRQTDADQLSKKLRELAPEQTTSPVIKTAQPFYGVPVPELRRLAKEWVRENRQLPTEQVMELFEQLWKTGVREELLLASFILGGRKDVLATIPTERFMAWTEMLDNWETTDQLASSVFGPWVKADPGERLVVCQELVATQNAWAQRLALAGVIRLARTPSITQFWPEVAGLLLSVSDKREAALPKAVSWVLRESIKGDPAAVIAFIAQHRDELPAIAVRETENKLESGSKRAITGRA